MSHKLLGIMALCAAMSMSLKGAEMKYDEAAAADLGLKLKTVEVQIEGLKRDYNFIWIADLHVISEDLSEVAEKDMDVVKRRISSTFMNRNSNKTALQVWKGLPSFLNSTNADGVLLGGDICDFGSLASIRELKAGFEAWKIPYMYARADHDICNWWMATNPKAEVKELEKSIDGDEPLMVMEFPDLIVVGYNNGCYNMSKEGVARFKEVYAKGKPIVMIIHTPIYSEMAKGISEKCIKEDWKHRNLTWGKGLSYSPNADTQELLDMVLQKDSLVKLVVAGHLHYEWDGMLTPTCREIMFEPAFKGVFGVIHLTGKK